MITGRCPDCGHPWDDHSARQHLPPPGSSHSDWVTGQCLHVTIVDEGRRDPCLCKAVRPGPPSRVS